MKKQLLFLLAVFAANLALANTRAGESSVWIAKLTEETQCQSVARPILGKALSEIETAAKVHVNVAMVDFLKGRAMCLACNCPAGSYYIAQIKNPSSDQAQILKSNDWEIVNPDDLPFVPQSKAVESEENYRPLPVSPEI